MRCGHGVLHLGLPTSSLRAHLLHIPGRLFLVSGPLQLQLCTVLRVLEILPAGWVGLWRTASPGSCQVLGFLLACVSLSFSIHKCKACPLDCDKLGLFGCVRIPSQICISKRRFIATQNWKRCGHNWRWQMWQDCGSLPRWRINNVAHVGRSMALGSSRLPSCQL